jgi:hypothetical protein
MAKAKKKRTTPGEKPQPPEANPHFLGRFTPTRLSVSPLYRQQHDSLGTMSPTEQRRYRHLRDKALKAGLGDASPPAPRGIKGISDDESLLPGLRQFLQRAERLGLTRTAALRRWVTETEEGRRLPGRTTNAKVARLGRKLREARRG